MIKDELNRVVKKIPCQETFPLYETLWEDIHNAIDSGDLREAGRLTQVLAKEFPEYEDTLYEVYYGLDSIMFDSKYGE